TTRLSYRHCVQHRLAAEPIPTSLNLEDMANPGSGSAAFSTSTTMVYANDVALRNVDGLSGASPHQISHEVDTSLQK
ncbi:MAG: hypothetical protein WAM44_06415, partial [Chthoniobacterales bacterium]